MVKPLLAEGPTGEVEILRIQIAELQAKINELGERICCLEYELEDMKVIPC